MKKKLLLTMILTFVMFIILVQAKSGIEIKDVRVIEQSSTITLEDLSYENNVINS